MSWASPLLSAGHLASAPFSAPSSALPPRVKRSAPVRACLPSIRSGLPFPSGSPPAFPAPSWAFSRFRRHLGTVEKIMGGLLVLTGLAFIFGYVSDMAIWFQQTFPILMKIG